MASVGLRRSRRCELRSRARCSCASSPFIRAYLRGVRATHPSPFERALVKMPMFALLSALQVSSIFVLVRVSSVGRALSSLSRNRLLATLPGPNDRSIWGARWRSPPISPHFVPVRRVPLQAVSTAWRLCVACQGWDFHYGLTSPLMFAMSTVFARTSYHVRLVLDVCRVR